MGAGGRDLGILSPGSTRTVTSPERYACQMGSGRFSAPGPGRRRGRWDYSKWSSEPPSGWLAGWLAALERGEGGAVDTEFSG